MICNRCGFIFNGGSWNCPRCGNRVEQVPSGNYSNYDHASGYSNAGVMQSPTQNSAFYNNASLQTPPIGIPNSAIETFGVDLPPQGTQGAMSGLNEMLAQQLMMQTNQTPVSMENQPGYMTGINNPLNNQNVYPMAQQGGPMHSYGLQTPNIPTYGQQQTSDSNFNASFNPYKSNGNDGYGQQLPRTMAPPYRQQMGSPVSPPYNQPVNSQSSSPYGQQVGNQASLPYNQQTDNQPRTPYGQQAGNPPSFPYGQQMNQQMDASQQAAAYGRQSMPGMPPYGHPMPTAQQNPYGQNQNMQMPNGQPSSYMPRPVPGVMPPAQTPTPRTIPGDTGRIFLSIQEMEASKNQTDTPAPEKKNGWMAWLIVLIVVLVIMIGLLLGYYFGADDPFTLENLQNFYVNMIRGLFGGSGS